VIQFYQDDASGVDMMRYSAGHVALIRQDIQAWVISFMVASE
jgi:hypothetical protein